MENLALERDGTLALTPDARFWAGRRVLVTGHTGFKGSWLLGLLNIFGARVTGLSLTPDTTPAMFDLIGGATHRIGVRFWR